MNNDNGKNSLHAKYKIIFFKWLVFLNVIKNMYSSTKDR